jgi:hypothetical protein
MSPRIRLLTCIVTVMVGYLGTYSAYVERSGLPCPLGRTDSRRATSGACLASARFAASSFTKTGH